MYRVLIPRYKSGRSLGEVYYDKFSTIFRAALQRKLRYRSTWTVGIFGHPNDNVNMKLLPGSKAETFIKHCIKSDYFMRVLLYGNMRQMNDLFQVLKRWIGNDWELNKLSDQDKLQLSQQQSHGVGPVCHFHSVIKHIFVGALYESELDKEWVSKRKLLNFCPYCGDASVFVTNHVGVDGNDVVSKTVLDHYLPKSEFPYFAVNIFNLFPCCERCNSDVKKGDKMPIEKDAAGTIHSLIMYPHHFDESRLTFAYIPPTSLHPNDDIELMCADAYLEKGYKSILGIEALYKHYKGEAKDMIDRASDYLTQSAMNYGRQTFGFDKRFMDFYVKSTLGFNPYDKKPMDVQRYKFKMDIFRQINRQLNIWVG